MSGGGMETKRITRFLQLMIERGASDMHFSVGRPPMFRISGEIDPLRYRVLSNRDYVDLIRPIVGGWRTEHFLTTGDLDFSFAVPDLLDFGQSVHARGLWCRLSSHSHKDPHPGPIGDAVGGEKDLRHAQWSHFSHGSHGLG